VRIANFELRKRTTWEGTKSGPDLRRAPRWHVACRGDTNHGGSITVDEILTAVNNALTGCT